MPVGEIVSIHRVKILVGPLERLARRFAPVEKSPPKLRDMRRERPPSRIALMQRDAVEGLQKYATRKVRNAKLRFFRIFKLFNDLKTREGDVGYRPLGERLRMMRWMHRL